MADMEELVVRIKADASQLERELKKAQGVVQQSGKGMSSALSGVAAQARALLPVLSAATFVAFAKGAFEAADRLNDLSQRTGVAASTLSALNIPLKQSGSSVEEFASSINRMNNFVGEAAKGISKDALKAFDDLGLSVRKLEQLSPEDQFSEIADALSKMGSQSEMTNAGMAIFGRSFATLIPLIKESNGNLDQFIEKLKTQGSSLSEEQLKRIDEYGDKWVSVWEHAKLGALGFLDVLFQIHDWVSKQPNPSGALMLARVGIPPVNNSGVNPNVSSKHPGHQWGFEQFGPPKPSAKGSNKDIANPDDIKKAAQALKDYNTQLAHQHEFALLSPADAAQRKAYYDLLALAQKAGVKDAEAYALAESQVAKSTYEMAEAQEEAARFTAELKDEFAQMAGDVIFNAKSMGDAFSQLAQSIAKMIIQKQILGPLADSLFGAPGSGKGGGIFGSLFSSIFSGLGFAEGGDPPIGKASMVGENGPEYFIPKVPGTIVPAGAMGGGGGVVVNQYFQVSNDVPALIDAKIRNSAPIIASAAHDAVFASMRTGGTPSKIAGLR